MIDEMKSHLAYIDLDLEEVLNGELKYLSKIDKPFQDLQGRLDEIVEEVENEIDKIEPDLEKLELLKIEYQELLYIRYEFTKQYLIGSETIATIELEEIND